MDLYRIRTTSINLSIWKGQHYIRTWVHGHDGTVLTNVEYGPMTLREALDTAEAILRTMPRPGDEAWMDLDGRFHRQLSLLED